MVFKWIKRGVIVAGGLALVGGLLFGKDLISYARSSARSVRAAVTDSIPTEFELQRARDLLDDIIPEMHANIRLIATEEVEIAALKADIADSGKRLTRQRNKVHDLTGHLSVERASFDIGGRHFTRAEAKDLLARRFDRFKEAELVLGGKQRLLRAREESLLAAIHVLERTRSQKALLADKVAALEARHRLVQAAAAGSNISVDRTKMAQAAKLIDRLKKRLDVAERILAHEARFIEPIPTETISEADLLAQVREHMGEPDALAMAPPERAAPTEGQDLRTQR